ncbi:MAG: DUF4936 family protein [Rubrivivax sp.]|nr:MAG: DUF4936 family protein [Rubrivivax sp.]
MNALYIYYRVQAPCPEALAPAVHAMQARLRARMPGLAAGLHRRIEPSSVAGSGPSAGDTWMETYQFNGHADHRAWASFDAALAAEVGLLPAGIDGLRHAERFEPMPTSARPAGATSTLKG